MSLLTNICGRLRSLTSFPLQNMKHCGNQTLLNGTTSVSTSWGYPLITRYMSSLESMIRNGPPKKRRKPKTPQLTGCPQKKGVVLKVMIKKPKKPNSANRKCVRVRLTNGIECNAYVPGEGHSLQEHSIVLVEGGRVKDLPAVKLRCVRGKYDLAHVKKKSAI